MRHCRTDYEAIQPWPTRRPHIARDPAVDGPVYFEATSIDEAAIDPLIPEDEPVFILRAKDHSAPEVVRFWADLNREHGADLALTDRVAEWADEMRTYAIEHYNGGKTPDTPAEFLSKKGI